MSASNEKFMLEKNQNMEVKRSLSKQFLLGILANFSSIAPSMSLGFSAVALPALTTILNPYALTPSQASWFASIASLATPFGSFFSGPISDKFGRRTALFCVNIICFIGWLTIAAAYYLKEQQYTILLIGRLLTGFSTGLCSMPATIYMAEVSSDKLRGVFTTWSSISFSLGVLLVYMLGFFIKEYWGTISLITAAFPCIGMLFAVFFMPESPSWLVGKSRYDEARETMRQIYGAKEYNSQVEQEVETLIRNKGVKIVGGRKTTFLEQVMKKIKILLKPTCLKPFLLVLTFFFFQQFSGIFVIVFYAINIVQDAGVQVDPYGAIVLIGLTRLCSAVLLSYISKKVGRRPLSIFSGIFMSLCMLVLGVYILLIKQQKVSETTQNSLSWLPILLLLVYFFASTVGFLTLPFAMSAELFPAKIRGTASGLSSCIGYIFSFIAVKMYQSMVVNLDKHGVFFFYGGVSLVGTVFVYCFLPETRGKSFQEIQEYFESKKKTPKEVEMEKLGV